MLAFVPDVLHMSNTREGGYGDKTEQSNNPQQTLRLIFYCKDTFKCSIYYNQTDNWRKRATKHVKKEQ